ncbi:MAG: DUF5946 family protein [Shimia sp.]
MCPGCGFSEEGAGPTHPYLSVSPACWARYGRVMAREYSDRAYWPSHRRLVDAYAGQHSLGADRRARQSLWIHMSALLLTYEYEVSDARIREFLGRAAKSGHPFPELEMPRASHSVDVGPVVAARDPEEHRVSVAAYARDLIAAWAPYHDEFRSLIAQVPA